MNKHSFLLLYITLIILTVGTTGCEKLLEINPPFNERSSELIFNSDQTAQSALSGAYGMLSNSQTYSRVLTTVNGMASDELLYRNGSLFDYVILNTYDPVNSSLMNDLWNESYASIYRFNSVIEGLAGPTAVSPALVRRLTAEAKFMRALLHLNLLQLFNQIPLITTTNVNQTALAPRNTRAQVFTQIITDLEQAKTDLGADYSAVGNNRLQPNKWAATALLARVYLYNQNWQQASSNATEVINQSGLYSLVGGTTLSSIYLKNSREAILQLGSYLRETTGYTGEGAAFVSSATTQTYTLRPSLLASFEPGDLRRKQWVRETTFGGTINYEPYKFQNNTSAAATTSGRQEAPTLLRLAEQYLIRAEAKIHLQDLTGATADLNVIRSRSGLAARPGGTAETLQGWIEQENRIEFFCEQGHRWFDLNRTDRINVVMQAEKPQTWQAFARWYPVPQTARDANPNLTQNEGYR